MKTLNITLLFALAVALLMFSSCKENSVSQEPPPEEEGETEIVDSVNVNLPADSGEVGLVINAREIFRKGYKATEADVKFPSYSEFDETLEIHPVTNVAVLRIPNEELTEDEKNAFAVGVAMDIIIYDDSQMQLAEYHDDEQVLDDTNTPLTIQTELDYNIPPVTLKEGIPYLLQPEKPDDGSVIRASGASTFTVDIPDIEDITSAQEFYFESVTNKPDTYKMKREGSAAGPYFYNVDGVIGLSGDEEGNGAQEFVFEQDEDGWVRIREAGNEDMYLSIVEAPRDRKEFQFINNADDRFRFISANIEWAATDRGTEFNQAVIPSAEIEFAYEATIKNCSSGTLTEEVGVTKSRTSTRSLETTESLELFAGAEASVGVTTGVSAGVSVPGVGDVSASVEVSANFKITTSATTTTANTLANSKEVTSEVSRVRTLEVPPFSGTEVYDAVRVIKNARVPYIQVLRLTAQYTNGPVLSGDEIMTQMLFNFVGGVPLEVGDDYVDVGLSGTVHINEMFETETGANDLPDACN